MTKPRKEITAKDVVNALLGLTVALPLVVLIPMLFVAGVVITVEESSDSPWFAFWAGAFLSAIPTWCITAILTNRGIPIFPAAWYEFNARDFDRGAARYDEKGNAEGARIQRSQAARFRRLAQIKRMHLQMKAEERAR